MENEKSVVVDIKLSSEQYDLINKFDGKSFDEKFNNFALYIIQKRKLEEKNVYI